MIRLRQRTERGHTNIGWLDSYHTFSFGDYHDPQNMGFSDLRVINDDRVEPGQGFNTHPHRDMEIITYVLEGTLAHKDSLGNGSLITAGEVQRMSAGTGIQHSEFNPSDSDPVHLLQIWIFPDQKGITPSYEQKRFDASERHGRWQCIASGNGRDASVRIHQDAELWLSRLEPGQMLSYTIQPERAVWLHVTTGTLLVNAKMLEAGDALAISEGDLALEGLSRDSEVLLFNLRKPGTY